MTYPVVIPTAGIGSRLGSLTKYINKSLVSVANRPTLSHQLEQFPVDCEFIIALGYKGNLVREFIEIAYPNLNVYFVEVDPYEGAKSGLGYTLMSCEQYLRQPFIFLSCDTLVKEGIPSPEKNWIGYADLKDTAYRTISVQDKYVHGIHEKGDLILENTYAYIGLTAIKDYQEFWYAMHQGGLDAIHQGEAYGLRKLRETSSIEAYQFTWFDTGTPFALEQTRSAYHQSNHYNILEKENETIWFVGDQVIKFSDDKHFILNRVHRSSVLNGFVPKILASTDHMYSYKMVEGKVFSELVTIPLFKNLLSYSERFWQSADLTSAQLSAFKSRCREFYCDKTKSRIALFYQKFNKQDKTEKINGESMPTLSNLLDQIDWNTLANGFPGRFHGDFHFENILWNSKSEQFIFLDWRQDFGGNLDTGDVYYDLAKLLHGLIISHELIAANSFTVEWSEDEIRFDLHRKQVHVECEHLFAKWCYEKEFDYSKVRILTALIYLNIAALHHYPYSLMLYALGKQILHTELNQK